MTNAPGPFAGRSEMHARINAYDWASSGIGPVQSWPQSLRATITTILGSRYPMILLWGPDLVQIYNEAYIGLIGAKHPGALGRSIKETQAESWEVIGPMIHEVMSTGIPNWVPAQQLPLERAGYREESYFSLSYSAVNDDQGRITGMLCVCSEVTQQILGERRTRLLRDLALKAGEIRGAGETCTDIGAALNEHSLDVPFALLYLREPDGTVLTLRTVVGIDDHAAIPTSVNINNASDSSWPFERTIRGETVLVEETDCRVRIAGGPWAQSVCKAVAMPIASAEPGVALGVLIAGVSPNRAIDEGYASFYDLLIGQVSVALRNARAYEDERRRVEALAALDRAKTDFFSNVSHEFRTPLTLILGPIEEALADGRRALTGESLDMVRRNALRLQKLVNELLDFSRIEAGRMQARFVPVDLPTFTRNLISAFESAAANAALRLAVDCAPLSAPTYVDPEMWEKIVLNLLSNALKYTRTGEIRVALRQTGAHTVLSVADTGIGIPEDELPRVFERFYRARATQGRSHEGTGIGLALVRELVRLHGGTIDVQSEVGKGSIFTVHLPVGFEHLPSDRVDHSPTELSATDVTTAFVEEAQQWSSDAAVYTESTPLPATTTASSELNSNAKILLVDDNADLRNYVARILGHEYRHIKTASDGSSALAMAKQDPPDIILSDVMMPGLDGFALVQELRADPRTRATPIILLSARAGEESTVGGLASGADDYLVKPFSARELLARVRTQLQMVSIRREMAKRDLVEQGLRDAINMRDDFLAVASHELRTPLTTLALQVDTLVRLSKGGGQGEAPDLMRKLEMIRRQASRMETLVQRLLDVSVIAAGRLRLYPENVDVATVVCDVVNEFKDEADRSGTPLSVVAENATLYVDRTRLEQTLRALITNALKFGPGKPIDIKASTNGDGVSMIVKDRGIGIAHADQGRIFERFERAVPTSHYGGLGLGLWIVRELVTAMHGRIRLESEPGAGSTFTVELPLRVPG